jgi:hypothetical protein
MFLSQWFKLDGLDLAGAIALEPPQGADMSSIRSQAHSKARLNAIRILAFGMLAILPATSSSAQQTPSIAEQIAKAYGLDSFGQIESIRYTWNVEFPAGKISNTWEWNPKTDTVSYEGKDKEGNPVKANYQRSQLESQSDDIKKKIDPAFANDQYWALLPFHIAWDGATITDEGVQKMPLSGRFAERIVAKYPSDGGYQPGDTWDLYVGADKRIAEIVYHRGADNPPKLVMASYEDYKQAGPLLFSTDHHGTIDGKPFRIWLSDVAVKLTGSDKWINAQ